jgi:hypothetical protein
MRQSASTAIDTNKRAATTAPILLPLELEIDELTGTVGRADNQHKGVRHVVLPRQSRETRSRMARAALRWRTGIEGRISALKRRHGLRRSRTMARAGCKRWVGLGVIANNLLVLGRAGP